MIFFHCHFSVFIRWVEAWIFRSSISFPPMFCGLGLRLILLLLRLRRLLRFGKLSYLCVGVGVAVFTGLTIPPQCDRYILLDTLALLIHSCKIELRCLLPLVRSNIQQPKGSRIVLLNTP